MGDEHEGKSGADEAGGGETPPPQVPLQSEKPARADERRGLSRLLTRRAALIVVALAALVSSFLYLRRNTASLRSGVQKAEEVLGIKPTPTPDPYAEAVAKVEEDRGEPAGRQAKVEVPDELKQYKEPRRFLARQAAAVRNGRRDCVTVTLQDGRTMTCTPDAARPPARFSISARLPPS